MPSQEKGRQDGETTLENGRTRDQNAAPPAGDGDVEETRRRRPDLTRLWPKQKLETVGASQQK